jgi:tryptophan-rich sensory protein
MKSLQIDRSFASKWGGLIGWIALCYLIAFAGALVSPGMASPDWYDALAKPAWNPPNWLFGPVWTTLYTLMGISAWMIWKDYGFRNARAALSVFLFQLLLNGLWSQLFFGLQLIGWAFVEVVILAIAIFATIVVFHKKNQIAAWLLVPYLLWVLFASVLNGTIWWLN